MLYATMRIGNNCEYFLFQSSIESCFAILYAPIINGIVIPVVITPLSFNKLINVNANGCWLITVRFSFKLVVIVLELFPPNSDSGDYKKKVWSC